jgi:AraC family transcriptional regulator
MPWLVCSAERKKHAARFCFAERKDCQTGRSAARLDNLKLQEPIVMDSTAIDHLQAPRFETAKPLLIAGIGERYNCESSAGIPGQWQRFHQEVQNIPGRIGQVAYGVCCNGDDAGNFDYIAGVEVSDFSAVRIQPRSDSRTEICGLYPPGPHLDHSPHRRYDLESMAAGVRPQSGRRAQFRAV